ncbi:glycoside hydrolase family 88/105 protein [Belliella aquatica]|uniref:Glycosyl hydrolase family 88 n=1 Tax=Belliella aquatica TaxID=1323734 RepID=A0ABQ1LPJ3_9BACT|nr:glycoside hydrolase family 88 protein [Belliella aquatica]MCH7404375.1 glycoside hydrolase family 88 protein [Belliella aquatica]GGC27551.1 glycosyl hydrolase family 88 [Belliella aquatica]
MNNIITRITKPFTLILFSLFLLNCQTQQEENTTAEEEMTDSNTPLHLLQPDYPTPYGAPEVSEVKAVLDRVKGYLEETTHTTILTEEGGTEITDFSKADEKSVLKKGDFRLLSYEWGVTYSAMLLAGEITGDESYTNYTKNRVKFLADLYPHFEKMGDKRHALHSIVAPGALDDCGALCASFIKTEANGLDANVNPLISNFMDYIMNKEFKLEDGTLARNRPLNNTLWLDDLYMSVPAIAQMGKKTGEQKYFDEAVNQIKLFSDRMFNKEKELYMHGWVADMEVHPEFHWARANGWALLTKVEVLKVLPENHPGRAMVLDLLQKHIRGLAALQSGSGFWHQLLDKNDSYLETSATAIYAYCIAAAVNEGWIDDMAHAPMAILAWNAVATMVNDKGQVEGTCVGTGMAFDPAFYYHRPVNKFAAHGYGPVVAAGAEIIRLLQENEFEINDSSLQILK